ncbi:phage major tail tube protein [Candidatus Albibeggiatoa sp. nov. NOAA]|uniref:phage major tail tube protein n=1 Tax=Candidatus Albibeggiatoa sp. nov. NOAA TaxID=3162724 RepID=UPI0032F9A43C|nr:phage major tail tube protein [Thiotrichaceae bacterium]
MSITAPFTLKHFNAKIEGEDQSGLLLSINIPAITPEIGTHQTAMGTPVPVFMGFKGYPKLTFKTAEYGKLQKYMRNLDGITISGYGSLNDNSETTKSVQLTATGILSYTPSPWAPIEKTEDTYEMACYYLNYSGNGSNVTVDTKSNKFIVDGEDLIETLRGRIKI